ncbi:hypothetical protein COW98_04980 [Candidatus Roizmanbacteria bacterium CG22_combo_CG10-13_8_21_14_all_35_9]|uniref:Uncharacterized protein n=4 Tax=Candidatus Roizmaniibacteriota TaxID=1752723 RepID=A0A2M8F4P2_9BACT|nr:MAG: hypothetical protein COX47_00920 [Candidatus Roizmanbacteria bacterium CG23_combo_of_CG06-09_8_20_14_all_35_49]PIP62265.1 MAG: hypothetical protein COW98_04980 [Candidatus Roizmanbacteria bacterium CG22_combo_CG10-13_8_21_14_all_35_9]PIY70862.1 MAG: hypothetical protein COY88_03445 [Candidatus Roizmanbacteria bacterium CG_4_10_14_0_8_um_filter_35_28]PJC34273.1 MAG: hypothetical protein CO048_00760 [Candidatus Roizmanbacteria bacterium CG_4_9_14_0_2_um_filter_35_15]PJC82837.1 MAG: hypoth
MKINKNVLIIGAVLLVLLAIGYWLLGRKNIPKNNQETISPTEIVLPTIDSSVKVDLQSVSGGKDVTLSINNIPSGTDSVDYELSYQTAQQGIQGVIGTIDVSNQSDYEKKITLGTCSSGTCVYHQVVGKIKLTLKFTGDYGEKLFEKEYEL